MTTRTTTTDAPKPLAAALDLDEAPEAGGAVDQLGRRPGVQPEFVDDLKVPAQHRRHSSTTGSGQMQTPSRPPARAFSVTTSSSSAA